MLHLNPTVFVVDPDASVRGSLEAVIRRAGWTPRTFASVGEFLTHPRRMPSCLVVEVSHLDLAGFDLLRRIAAEREETPVVAVAAGCDISMAVRAFQAGAMGFLMKPLADDALLTAVRDAIDRSRVILDRKADLFELRSRYDSLSGREQEVMAGVVAGHLNKRIGAALGISEITVKAHRGKAMRKMGADSVAKLVIMAMRLELPSVPTTTDTIVQWRRFLEPRITSPRRHQTDEVPNALRHRARRRLSRLRVARSHENATQTQ